MFRGANLSRIWPKMGKNDGSSVKYGKISEYIINSWYKSKNKVNLKKILFRILPFFVFLKSKLWRSISPKRLRLGQFWPLSWGKMIPMVIIYSSWKFGTFWGSRSVFMAVLVIFWTFLVQKQKGPPAKFDKFFLKLHYRPNTKMYTDFQYSQRYRGYTKTKKMRFSRFCHIWGTVAAFPLIWWKKFFAEK